MDRALKTFERTVVVTLLGLMSLVVLVSTVELAIMLFGQLMKPPLFFLNMAEMLEVFGFFMMVLIGLELLESIRAYVQEERVHTEVLFLVALVAVCRKVIILDYGKITPEILYGMSALIVALGIGYFLVRRGLHVHTADTEPPSN